MKRRVAGSGGVWRTAWFMARSAGARVLRLAAAVAEAAHRDRARRLLAELDARLPDQRAANRRSSDQ